MDSLTSLLVCLLCTLNSVSSQSVRNGFIGGDVLLPCIYTDHLTSPVKVFWRDRNDNVVVDIVEGSEDKSDAKFKGRVLSYPDQFKNGNFSILIKNLTADDVGPYDCHIPRVDYESKLTLRLTEKPAVKGTSPRPPLTPPTPDSRGAAVASSLHLALLSAPLLVLFCSLK